MTASGAHQGAVDPESLAMVLLAGSDHSAAAHGDVE